MLYAIFGVIFGVVGGMGMGGGIVLIPALTLILSESQHSAQGLNLVAFLPMAVCALFLHIKNRRVEKKLCLYMCIGGALGAVAGAFIATAVDGTLLAKIFGGFLIALSAFRIYTTIKSQKIPKR